MGSEFLVLDGYEVVHTTERAIAVIRRPNRGQAVIWLPRSVVQDHDALERRDTDICVARWFAEREGLKV